MMLTCTLHIYGQSSFEDDKLIMWKPSAASNAGEEYGIGSVYALVAFSFRGLQLTSRCGPSYLRPIHRSLLLWLCFSSSVGGGCR